MNHIEEQLWNYLDGLGTEQEREHISYLIASDKVYQQKYNELLTFNQELESIELDVPPMAFTYNVMESIRNEAASKPLKAAIDNRIIKSIAAFFAVTILVLLGIALANTHWDGTLGDNMHIPFNLHLPSLKGLLNNNALKGFVFFDIVLALYLFDGYLRKGRSSQNM